MNIKFEEEKFTLMHIHVKICEHQQHKMCILVELPFHYNINHSHMFILFD